MLLTHNAKYTCIEQVSKVNDLLTLRIIFLDNPDNYTFKKVNSKLLQPFKFSPNSPISLRIRLTA